ncbi:MAG: zinc-ribbon domain-containing protein, partial [Gemmatimonadota bacterium]|nr:zinc-ribbon domain-containing protein [Gemmatimonadota bacterium]
MNVTCPECRSVFRVDPTKLPAASVRARCAVCGGLITITPSSSVRDEFAPPRAQNERVPAALPPAQPPATARPMSPFAAGAP